MAGSIRKKNNGYEIRAYVGRDPLTNKPRQISRIVDTTSRRVAEKALRALQDTVDKQGLTGARHTVSHLLTKWIDHAGPELSPTTLRLYKGIIANYLLPAFGSYRIDALDAHAIDRFYRAVRKKGVTPQTIMNIHRVGRRAFRQAELWNWIGVNPFRNATPPTVRRSELKMLTPEQFMDSVRAVEEENQELAVAFFLAGMIGARRGELLALRWRHVDFDNGILTIARALIETPASGLIEKDTKTHAVRRVSLDPPTIYALQKHRQYVDNRATAVGVVIPPNGYLFSTDPEGEKPWKPQYLSNAWRYWKEKLNLGDARLHDLRHFNGSEQIARGVPITTVSQRLGHAKTSTTLDLYAHALPAGDKAAATALGEMVEGAERK